MPYNLIVILAPKIVRLDEEGDIIANKRERKGSMDIDSSHSKVQPIKYSTHYVLNNAITLTDLLPKK